MGVQPQITVQELIMAEETIRADEGVRKLAADVGELLFLQLSPFIPLFGIGWSNVLTLCRQGLHPRTCLQMDGV